MSALAMFLTAAMAVPGEASTKVSGEIVRGLDLRGEWEGVLYHRGESHKGKGWIYDGEFAFIYRRVCNIPHTGPSGLVKDEGNGYVRIGEYMGIYEQRGDRLQMCLCLDGKRPTSFQVANDFDEYLFILHRVKPDK